MIQLESVSKVDFVTQLIHFEKNFAGHSSSVQKNQQVSATSEHSDESVYRSSDDDEPIERSMCDCMQCLIIDNCQQEIHDFFIEGSLVHLQPKMYFPVQKHVPKKENISIKVQEKNEINLQTVDKLEEYIKSSEKLKKRQKKLTPKQKKEKKFEENLENLKKLNEDLIAATTRVKQTTNQLNQLKETDGKNKQMKMPAAQKKFKILKLEQKKIEEEVTEKMKKLKELKPDIDFKIECKNMVAVMVYLETLQKEDKKLELKAKNKLIPVANKEDPVSANKKKCMSKPLSQEKVKQKTRDCIPEEPKSKIQLQTAENIVPVQFKPEASPSQTSSKSYLSAPPSQQVPAQLSTMQAQKYSPTPTAFYTPISNPFPQSPHFLQSTSFGYNQPSKQSPVSSFSMSPKMYESAMNLQSPNLQDSSIKNLTTAFTDLPKLVKNSNGIYTVQDIPKSDVQNSSKTSSRSGPAKKSSKSFFGNLLD